MARPTGDGTGGQSTSDARSETGELLRQIFVSGVAITIPIIVTVVVLVFVVNFVLGLVGPGVGFLTDLLGVGQTMPDVALEVLAVATVLAGVFVVGFVAETRSGGGIEETFDRGVARIPGIGSVYTSFNEMSELLLSSDSQSFREVKLVEFPTEGSYTIAFVTADAPDPVEEGTDHDEMTTLFMPMAPNPVMGGFVLHVSDDRVHDIDISVEEGIQSIVTSGVTVGSEREVSSDIGEIEPVSSPAELARSTPEGSVSDEDAAGAGEVDSTGHGDGDPSGPLDDEVTDAPGRDAQGADDPSTHGQTGDPDATATDDGRADATE